MNGCYHVAKIVWPKPAVTMTRYSRCILNTQFQALDFKHHLNDTILSFIPYLGVSGNNKLSRDRSGVQEFYFILIFYLD